MLFDLEKQQQFCKRIENHVKKWNGSYLDAVLAVTEDMKIVNSKDNKELGYIFYNKENIVNSITRTQKNNSYASGIQVLNLYKINQLTKKTQCFYNVWNNLIEKKNLTCSNINLKNWSSIDTIECYKQYSKISCI
jgi:hypothetical protein